VNGRERREEKEAAGKKHSAPVIAPSRRSSARPFILLGALLVTAAAYVATGGWRERLLEESARSRQVIAVVERERAAREQRADREKGLAAALQSHPGLVEVRLELAQLRWADAGPQAAAAVLQPDRTRGPFSPLFPLRGREHSLIGQRTSPRFAPPPPDPRLLRLLAAAQRLMGRQDLALATLDRAIRVAPSEGDLRAERAMLFSLLGWFPQAEAALRDAARRGAKPLQIALVRATIARQQDDRRAARRELESARRRSPDDPEVIKQLAAIAEAEGHAVEAAHWLASIAESEADPDVWVALARLALREMETEGHREAAKAQAEAALQRALALRPEMPAARQLLGRWQRLSGDPVAARATLEPLYHERRQQEGVAFDLAQVYRDLGMRDRVGPLMARYQASLRRREVMHRAAMRVMNDPDSAPAHLEMGRLCLERGMIGRAILSFERARTLDPRLPGVREALTAARRAPRLGVGVEDAGAYGQSE
jgi:Flp pilus assembly protein TadD